MAYLIEVGSKDSEKLFAWLTMTDPARRMAYAPLYNKNGNRVQQAAASAQPVQGGASAYRKSLSDLQTKQAALEACNLQVPRGARTSWQNTTVNGVNPV